MNSEGIWYCPVAAQPGCFLFFSRVNRGNGCKSDQPAISNFSALTMNPTADLRSLQKLSLMDTVLLLCRSQLDQMKHSNSSHHYSSYGINHSGGDKVDSPPFHDLDPGISVAESTSPETTRTNAQTRGRLIILIVTPSRIQITLRCQLTY